MILHGAGLRSEWGLDVRLLRFWNRPGAEEPAMLAEDLLAAGRPQEAIRVVEAALELDSADAEVMVAGARAWEESGNLDRAQLLLTRAATAEPSWSEPWRRLGELLVQRGRFERAKQLLERAREVAPPEDLDDVSRRARASAAAGDRAPERRALGPAEHTDPGGPEAWHRYVDVLVEDGDLSAAEEAVTEALSHHPTDSRLICLQMRVEEELGWDEDENETTPQPEERDAMETRAKAPAPSEPVGVEVDVEIDLRSDEAVVTAVDPEPEPVFEPVLLRRRAPTAPAVVAQPPVVIVGSPRCTEPALDAELEALLAELERETVVPTFRDTLPGVPAPCLVPMPHAFGIARSRKSGKLRTARGRRPYRPPAPSQLYPSHPMAGDERDWVQTR